MKYPLLILVIILMLFEKSKAQDTIFAIALTPSSYNFFDLNNRDTTNKYFYIDSSQGNNIWQLGTPSKALFDSAYSPILALVTDTINPYPINNRSSFTFILWTDCNWTQIGFLHRVNTDSLTDGGVLEYSIDGGLSWENIINSTFVLHNFYTVTDSISSNSNNLGFSGNMGWISSWFAGPTLNEVVYYRFTFTSDSINSNRAGWMIDDILVWGQIVGIDENVTKSTISVYPNPTSDFISIQNDTNDALSSISLRNVSGQIILVSKKNHIDLTPFNSGIYFIEVLTKTNKYFNKIMKF